MKNLLITASLFVALCGVSTSWAQVESPSDLQIAVDEARSAAFEAQTGLPTGYSSWALQAGEAAVNEFGSQAAINTFESLSGPIGAGLSAFSPSYTAGPEMDEVTPLPFYAVPSDGAFVDSYLQQMQAQQDAQYQFDGLYSQLKQNQLKHLKPAPTGPSISSCSGCTITH